MGLSGTTEAWLRQKEKSLFSDRKLKLNLFANIFEDPCPLTLDSYLQDIVYFSQTTTTSPFKDFVPKTLPKVCLSSFVFASLIKDTGQISLTI